jgi:hypothetical protein
MEEKKLKLIELKKERQLLLDLTNGCISFSSLVESGYRRLDHICEEIDMLENDGVAREIHKMASIYPVAL